MSNAKVYVFNGPPSSGKNKAGEFLTEHFKVFGSKQLEFKGILFSMAANFLSITVEQFMDGYYDKVKDRSVLDQHIASFSLGDDCKDKLWKDAEIYTTSALVDGEQVHYRFSKRSALIHVSEVVGKPIFGDDFVGEAAAAQIPEDGHVFFTDSGFPDELVPVAEKVGYENVVVVRVHRDGCTYDGDSRRYLESSDFDDKITFVDIDNDGDLEELYAKALNVVIRSGKKINFAFDVDNTVCNPVPAWIEFMKERSTSWHPSIDRLDVEAYWNADGEDDQQFPYALANLFRPKEGYNLGHLYSFWNETNAYDQMEVLEESKKLIRKLYEAGHGIYFISYCFDTGNHVQSKINMLRRGYDFIKTEDFNFIDAKHKEQYARLFDVFIDDRLEYIADMPESVECILLDTPFGEQKECYRSYYPAGNWSAIDRIIDHSILKLY